MTPNVVVDVGNSRIKWGLCAGSRVAVTGSLPPDDEKEWQARMDSWQISPGSWWVMASVNPHRARRFRDFLERHVQHIREIKSFEELPIRLSVNEPEKVGIDRLLKAVAGLSRFGPYVPLAIVDTGTAVTVDWVDSEGAFRGGSIFPGFQLMARALNDYTAALPLIDEPESGLPSYPGLTTRGAITAGVFWAVAGGIRALLHEVEQQAKAGPKPRVCLTGGGARLFGQVLDADIHHWPEMTLEGIRISAEALR